MKNPNTHDIQELYQKYGMSTFTWSGIEKLMDSNNAVIFRFRNNTNTKNKDIHATIMINS